MKENRGLQAKGYHKGDSYFIHLCRQNPFYIVNKSNHMDDNENLGIKKQQRILRIKNKKI